MSELRHAILITNHHKPNSDGPRVVARPGVEGGDSHFVRAIKQTKVFLLQVSDGHGVFGNFKKAKQFVLQHASKANWGPFVHHSVGQESLLHSSSRGGELECNRLFPSPDVVARTIVEID